MMRRFWVMFMAGVLLSTMMVDDTEAAELPDQLKIGSDVLALNGSCLLYTSPSPRDFEASRMPSSA